MTLIPEQFSNSSGLNTQGAEASPSLRLDPPIGSADCILLASPSFCATPACFLATLSQRSSRTAGATLHAAAERFAGGHCFETGYRTSCSGCIWSGSLRMGTERSEPRAGGVVD